MNNLVTDAVFAPLDRDHDLIRVAGGNETEVYLTDDRRFAVKLKADLGVRSAADAVMIAAEMRTAAEEYAACLSPRHSIPSYYVVARDSQRHVQVLVLQPFLTRARQLYDLDYAVLSRVERDQIAVQLRDIIRRSLQFYRQTGSMPDLYGRTSANPAERKRLNAPHMLPWRLWSFLVKRNLLRAHNLMLTAENPPRIILVDYDVVRRSRLYRRVYYGVRWMLFWRDHALIRLMQRGVKIPREAALHNRTAGR